MASDLFNLTGSSSSGDSNAFANAEGMDIAGKAVGGMSIISDIFSGIMQYNNYRFREKQAQIMSQSVENTAQENIEMLREKLLQDITGASAAFGSRGVASSSGTVQSLQEESARNVGEDAKKIRISAKQKQSNLRLQEQVARSSGKLQLIQTGQRATTDIVKLFAGGF